MAARLSEQPGRQVLLVEAGPDISDRDATSRLLDADRLPAPVDPLTTADLLDIAGSDRMRLIRGRVVGGSSSINGAYFVRPTDADLNRWSTLGDSRWAASSVLPALRRLETDMEFGALTNHGDAGPIPVTRRSHALSPVTEHFFDACRSVGHPEQPDMNSGGGFGWGLVPRNIDARGRVGSALAYLQPARSRPNLTLGTESVVEKVRIESGRAVGVEILNPDGTRSVVAAGSVVLCAGALGSAELLWRSGIGSPSDLLAEEIAVAASSPGLGAAASTHWAVDLPYKPFGRPDPGAPLVQGALHLELDSGDVVEVLATGRPYGAATGSAPDDELLTLRVSSMSAWPVKVAFQREGVAMSAVAPWQGPTGRVMLAAVREASALASTETSRRWIAKWLGPGPEVLRDDRALSEWVAAHSSASHHLCATAPMGEEDDPGAVVDHEGRVIGVDALRVVDLSILPSVPTRGPAATAVMVAEHLASTFG